MSIPVTTDDLRSIANGIRISIRLLHDEDTMTCALNDLRDSIADEIIDHVELLELDDE